VDPQERKALVDDILAALDQRGTTDGSQLLELARVERELTHALAVIRRLIERTVAAGLDAN